MKKLILLGVAVVMIALTAAPVEAFGFRRNRGSSCEPCCEPCPKYTVKYEDRVVTCYKTVWKEREVPYTYQKPVVKEVVRKAKVTQYEQVWRDEKRTVVHYTHEPRVVERDVVRCVRVPVQCVDPCTGCVYTVCRSQLVTDRVKCTIYECVPHRKEVMVKVCDLKPVVREVDVRDCIVEYETVKTVRKERYCERVPYQVTVRVAVCVPCH